MITVTAITVSSLSAEHEVYCSSRNASMHKKKVNFCFGFVQLATLDLWSSSAHALEHKCG